MLKFLLLAACFLVAANACKEHEVCPLDLVLQDDGNLFIEYHAPAGRQFGQVIFKIKRSKNNGGRGKQKQVDQTPEDHEDHEDWSVVFDNDPDNFVPFEECQQIYIIVRSRTGGVGSPEVKGPKRIPGDACPEEEEA